MVIRRTLIHHNYFTSHPVPTDVGHVVFADPPYNYGVNYADDPTGDRLDDDRYFALCQRAISAMVLMAKNGATLWWMTPDDHLDWIPALLTNIVGPRLHTITWWERFAQYRGTQSLTSDSRFIFCHRVVKDPDTPSIQRWNPDDIRVESVRQKLGDKRANPLGRVPGTVWDFPRLAGTHAARRPGHPTQLPPSLLATIVKGWSNPGDTVVDAFCGSGSMIRVANSLGRHAIGLDQSATYLAAIDTEPLTTGDPSCVSTPPPSPPAPTAEESTPPTTPT